MGIVWEKGKCRVNEDFIKLAVIKKVQVCVKNMHPNSRSES
jgi:hypothetical protein